MDERLRRAIPVAVGLTTFVVSLAVLRVELGALSWHQLTTAITATPAASLAFAILLTGLNYCALIGYDLLAFVYIGNALSRVRIAWASFLAYAISNNVGFAMLSGASVRYRFYTRWGVTAEELSRIVFSYSVTFWLGLMALGGLSLVVAPPPADAGRVLWTRQLPARPILVIAGSMLLLVPFLYLLSTALRRAPFRMMRVSFPMPSLAIAAAQLLISMVDWALAGAVLYVLLPPGAPGFFVFLGAFLVSILLGMVSHVPGGVGVFEGLMVLLLKPYLGSSELLPALIVFRAVYYLLPFSIGLIGLVADEVWQQRAHVVRAGSALGRVSSQLVPKAMGLAAFVAGVVLLLSGATPGAPGRLALLDRVLPLPVIEASHFLGSVLGAVLLILSQGLARRLDAAYYLTSFAIVAGMFTSLLKGFDFEEATLLLVLLIALWRARPAFDRKAAFLDTRFSAGWIAALAGAIGSSVWLGFFAFKHVNYSDELWWQFELHGEASRFLRATVGAAVAVGLFGLARLIGYAPHDAPVPGDSDLDDAGRVIATQAYTFPFLVYLRDKALLFNDSRSAFVMYGVKGRTWVALGDPVGPPDQFPALVRQFLERCDDFGGVPVFYEVGRTHLHMYADFGLTFVKLGEEAKVDLTTFRLEGAGAAKHRQVVRRLEKDGASFRVLEPAAVGSAMAELREISDDWLAEKAGAEKGFSLGFFDQSYVSRFPVGVIERDGRIDAFANLWAGPCHEELSVDLMRYRHDAPKNVMEALLVHLMQWGKEQGYRRFVLGMAPLAGIEQTAAASLWNRMGAFLYEHGESIYHFQGLRAYKQKFDPVWEPRYLAYPGGLRLPRIMADVSALVAGGYRQIFRK